MGSARPAWHWVLPSRALTTGTATLHLCPVSSARPRRLRGEGPAGLAPGWAPPAGTPHGPRSPLLPPAQPASCQWEFPVACEESSELSMIYEDHSLLNFRIGTGPRCLVVGTVSRELADAFRKRPDALDGASLHLPGLPRTRSLPWVYRFLTSVTLNCEQPISVMPPRGPAQASPSSLLL